MELGTYTLIKVINQMYGSCLDSHLNTPNVKNHHTIWKCKHWLFDGIKETF